MCIRRNVYLFGNQPFNMYVKSGPNLLIKYLCELFAFSSAWAWVFEGLAEAKFDLGLISPKPNAHKMTQFAGKQTENSSCLLGKLSSGA